MVINGALKGYSPKAFQKCPAIKEVFVQEAYADTARKLFGKKAKLFTHEGVLIEETQKDRSDSQLAKGKDADSQALIDAVQRKTKIPKLTQWAEKKKLDIGALGKVKLNKKRKPAPLAAVLFIIHEYMSQMAQLPAYHRENWKSTTATMQLSREADEIAQELDKALLVSVLLESVTPIVEIEYDSEYFTYPIIWGKVPSKAKKTFELKNFDDFVEIIGEPFSVRFMDTDCLAPFCRYANEDGIKVVIGFAERVIKTCGQDGRRLSIAIRSALMLSDTFAAAAYLDKYAAENLDEKG